MLFYTVVTATHGTATHGTADLETDPGRGIAAPDPGNGGRRPGPALRHPTVQLSGNQSGS